MHAVLEDPVTESCVCPPGWPVPRRADANVSSADTHNLDNVPVHGFGNVAANNTPVTVPNKYLLDAGPPQGVRASPNWSPERNSKTKQENGEVMKLLSIPP